MQADLTIRTPQKTWALGIGFIVLNLVDTILTFAAVSKGNLEVGILYRFTGNLVGMSILKMVLALIVVGGLTLLFKKWDRAREILIGLNIGFLIICLWNLGVMMYG